MTRLRQARLLTGPHVRAVAWAPLPAAALAGVALLALEQPAALSLRLAAIALCLGAAFALDDVARDVLASSPSPLRFRSALRAALVVPPVAAAWGALLWWAGVGFGAGLTLELAGMLALTLAAAATAARLAPDGRGGAVAAMTLVAVLGAAALALPDELTLFAGGPEDPRWRGSHGRWAVVLGAALLAFARATRDPAGAPVLGPLGRRPGRPASRRLASDG